MIFEVFPSGPLETNSILVGCPQTHEAALFDAPPGLNLIIPKVLEDKHLKLINIYLTHSHWDHIGTVKHFQSQYKCKVFVYDLDARNLESPGTDGLPCFFSIEGATSDGFLEDGAWYSVGNLKFQAIHTPGHSPGGMSFYFPEERVLISGDTLFRGTIGKLRIPTGEPEKMWESLKKLSALPPETRVFPGHGETTTLKEENWLTKAREIFGV